MSLFFKRNSIYSFFVLRDPVWIDSELKGLYLWESSYEGTPDPQDGKIKLGVEVTPIEQVFSERYDSSIWCRRINSPNDKFTVYNLMKTHSIVYDKPYDFHPGDWIEAFIRKDKNPQKTERYFCSALAAMIYTECDILKKDTDWSIVRPSDFDIESTNNDKYIHFQEQCFLGPLEKLK